MNYNIYVSNSRHTLLLVEEITGLTSVIVTRDLIMFDKSVTVTEMLKIMNTLSERLIVNVDNYSTIRDEFNFATYLSRQAVWQCDFKALQYEYFECVEADNEEPDIITI